MAGVLEGTIEMHVHSSPDIRERKMDDLELMETAVKKHVRAMVIKSHCTSTAARAALINKFHKVTYGDRDSFQMFGAIALNHFVGGINPYAVEACLKMGGKIVWLPTIQSENQFHKEGKSGGVVCTENGHIIPAMKDVFQLVNDYDAVLATGHLSPEEIFIVVDAARSAGVKKIVVTHPEHNVVGMSLEQQKKIVNDYDVFLELCYAQPIGGGVYKKNLEGNCQIINEIGANHIFISTDSGQKQNPRWEDEWEEYIVYLLKHGISKSNVDLMTKNNPQILLGL
jgi:hypothetical protein